MNHGSLFSGCGGFDLAAEIVGWSNIFHCERDPFCQTILKHYWPHAKTFADIKAFNGKPYKGKIDIITGGFPCQPLSAAGKRRGTEDDRYLWPEMLRVIREIQPRWIVGENVQGIITWNDGMVFEQVHIDLEKSGYEVESFLLPASGINAPHRRYRTWFVARRKHAKKVATPDANTTGIGLSEFIIGKSGHEQTKQRPADEPCSRNIFHNWQDWPSQSPVCGGDDGLPDRLDNITLPKWRSESIKMFGNAIVPKMAVQLFEAIKQYEMMR